MANDPALKSELSGLIVDIVKFQRHTMLFGSPQDKLALVKAILPQMLGAMNTVAQDEEAAAERAAYDRILAMCRGEVATATEDSPPSRQVG